MFKYALINHEGESAVVVSAVGYPEAVDKIADWYLKEEWVDAREDVTDMLRDGDLTLLGISKEI
jgi:hypothetical protein